MTHFAVKRLAAVEISPGVSNQHELNAGILRRGLGFPPGRTEGALSILAYVEPNANPIALDGTFTLYNARENRPRRSPEYRMYYRLPGLVDLAQPGDLLVLFRDSESGGLHGALARPGTNMERRLDQSLAAGDHEAAKRMVVKTAAAPSIGDQAEWAQALLPLVDATDLTWVVRENALFASATRALRLPPTKQMAEAGREIAETVWGGGADADEFIVRGLDAESALYFEIERDVGTKSLTTLLDSGPVSLDEMLSWALRIQQSRKSRRGQSLQHHFGYLLERERIPFTAQAETERGERPDFVIPGETEYQDPSYPAEGLRMVGCKSTVRERWSQLLREADRIAEKYLLTVDEGLTSDVLTSIRTAGLAVFVPASTIHQRYVDDHAAGRVGTVAQLLESLRAVL